MNREFFAPVNLLFLATIILVLVYMVIMRFPLEKYQILNVSLKKIVKIISGVIFGLIALFIYLKYNNYNRNVE
ncbi:MAG: hypothetical protein JXB24_09340 [Bacteroidales bacterium]|nr:hypothetical protein [Bacteroidales bacterium]